MSEDDAIIPRTLATLALAVRHSKKSLTTRLDLIQFFGGHLFFHGFALNMDKNPDPLLFNVDVSNTVLTLSSVPHARAALVISCSGILLILLSPMMI